MIFQVQKKQYIQKDQMNFDISYFKKFNNKVALIDVNNIFYTYNDFVLEIQNSVSEFKDQNIDFLNNVNINYKGFSPDYSPDRIFDKIGVEPFLKIDSEFISYTIFELINNSIDYANWKSNNEPSIDITFKIDVNKFSISYNDNGIGFKEEDFGKVFEFDAKLESSSNSSGGGLWGMKSRLKNYDGEIILNLPSEFIITLPIYNVPEL